MLTCKYNLITETKDESTARAGKIKLNPAFKLDADGDLIIPKGRATCALDVADDGPLTLQEVADILGCTNEYVRQVEEKALALIRKPINNMLQRDSEWMNDRVKERPEEKEEDEIYIVDVINGGHVLPAIIQYDVENLNPKMSEEISRLELLLKKRRG